MIHAGQPWEYLLQTQGSGLFTYLPSLETFSFSSSPSHPDWGVLGTPPLSILSSTKVLASSHRRAMAFSWAAVAWPPQPETAFTTLPPAANQFKLTVRRPVQTKRPSHLNAFAALFLVSPRCLHPPAFSSVVPLLITFLNSSLTSGHKGRGSKFRSRSWPS